MTNSYTEENTAECISTSNNETVQHYDVIIAGGGLSGCLTALSLLQQAKLQNRTLSIAIIEAKNEAENHVESHVKNGIESSTEHKAASHIQSSSANAFDERVIALSHQTASYFKLLNIWQYLSPQATPIHTIHISDRGHYGKARIYAHEHQVEALGYVAPMTHIGESFKQGISHILNECSATLSVNWYCPDNIKAINWQSELVNVQLGSEKQLSANVLLACDGANSVCRKFAGISSSEKSYQQHAIIANVRMKGLNEQTATGSITENIAFERFTEFGPIAMLPLGEHRYSLVWTLKPEQAQEIAQHTNEEFIQAINKAFGLWQGGVVEAGKRSVFPLHLVQAESNVYHRMALVGNASHTIHPIAGQGFNLGVRDIQQLSDLVSKQFKRTLNGKSDLGEYALLNTYDLHRKNDQQHIISMTDSLVGIFSNSDIPLVIGRNTALKAMNYITPIKQRFVKKSMGY